MKAHRRMFAVGTMALSAALMAAPAYADGPEELEIDSEIISESNDRACKELNARGLDLDLISLLNDLDISCNDILNDVNILGQVNEETSS